jgi:hypothetical protein
MTPTDTRTVDGIFHSTCRQIHSAHVVPHRGPRLFQQHPQLARLILPRRLRVVDEEVVPPLRWRELRKPRLQHTDRSSWDLGCRCGGGGWHCPALWVLSNPTSHRSILLGSARVATGGLVDHHGATAPYNGTLQLRAVAHAEARGETVIQTGVHLPRQQRQQRAIGCGAVHTTIPSGARCHEWRHKTPPATRT